MRKHLIGQILLFLVNGVSVPSISGEAYWLVMGSYRQGPGGRPEVSGITSPSLYAIPMNSLKQCEAAGEQISQEIYRPVWQFDSRWTCVSGDKPM